jgi:putative ABC transport system permease protein
MFKLAWRNLAQQRLRLAISVGGVALAVLLILVMSGVFAGSEEHAVLYIRNQPAPIWVMQGGVSNLHMSSSILTPETVKRIDAVPGIKQVVGVLYASAGVEIGDTVVYSYVFGIDPDIPYGGPWSLVEGTANLSANEIVIDRDLAQRYGLGLGDSVKIMGFPLRIAGLSAGAFGIATNVTFVNKSAMALLMGVSTQSASYLLIQPNPQLDPGTLANAIRAAAPEASVMMQAALAASDQEMIRQMGADVIQVMNLVAYLIGLLVIAITVYTAVLERSREYGVLKAIGASPSQLLKTVLAQSFIAAGLGFVAGVILAYVTGMVVARLSPDVLILINPQQWLSQLPILILVTGAATLLPIQRIMRIDPLVVFKV